jgi:hypothetical protein
MTEIKRPNYFTSQFLVESDFNDEQKYHREMRYRHHQSFHTWGVVDGLGVTKTGNQVSISAGMAVDNEGREIILVPTDPAPQPLVLSGAGDVYITIEYQEVRDESDKDKTSGIVDQYRRITERPLIKSVGAQPPNDGKVILLAKVEKLADGNFGEPDNNVRTFASAKIADGAVTSSKIADGQISSSKIADAAITSVKIADGAIGTREIGSNSVTIDKLDPSIRSIVSINGVSNPAGNVELVATNAITLVPNTESKQIAIGEGHSALTDNPHGTTAAQVGALPITGGTINGGDLVLKGTADNAGDIIFQDSSGRQKGRIWTNPDSNVSGLSISSGDNTADITIDKDGKVGIGAATPNAKLQVAGGLTVLEQEPWQTPTLENGWVPFATGYNPPGYFKDSMGIVHLRGLVRSGKIGFSIFTLPIGYRPEFQNIFAASTAPDVYARLDVLTDGRVFPQTGSANSWLSLDGITFRAFVSLVSTPISINPLPINPLPINPLPVIPKPINPLFQ